MGTLCEAVLRSTHNLCFVAKLRKIGIPLHTPAFLYKSGVQGVYIAWTCFHDDVFDGTCQFPFVESNVMCLKVLACILLLNQRLILMVLASILLLNQRLLFSYTYQYPFVGSKDFV